MFEEKIKAGSLLAVLTIFGFSSAHAAVPIQRLSTDPYINPGAQHATEVEPDTYSFGNTIVSTFQVGRFFEGGATNIGFATSLNAGQSWTSGFLPGITPV